MAETGGDSEIATLRMHVQSLAEENEFLRAKLCKIENAAQRYLDHGGSVMANDLRTAMRASSLKGSISDG